MEKYFYPCYSCHTMTNAVLRQHLSCLAHIYDLKGYSEFDCFLTEEAAKQGNITILKWLVDNGCPWDIRTVRATQYYRNDECSQYALDRECPMEFIDSSEEEFEGFEEIEISREEEVLEDKFWSPIAEDEFVPCDNNYYDIFNDSSPLRQEQEQEKNERMSIDDNFIQRTVNFAKNRTKDALNNFIQLA